MVPAERRRRQSRSVGVLLRVKCALNARGVCVCVEISGDICACSRACVRACGDGSTTDTHFVADRWDIYQLQNSYNTYKSDLIHG